MLEKPERATPKQSVWKTFFSIMLKRTIIADLVQGVIVGAVLAFITANLLINAEVNSMQTTVNGWSTTLNYGLWGNNILLRAASARYLPAANLPKRRCTG